MYEAVASRQSIRAFTDRPVARAVLDKVLTAAARTPSGGNLQPWHIYVLSGDRLREWAEYHRTVDAVISPPPRQLLFCGMSIGFAHPATAHPYPPRAALSETVTFLE